ncbi:MAG: DUF6776 family protein [Halioglobus sp.]
MSRRYGASRGPWKTVMGVGLLLLAIVGAYKAGYNAAGQAHSEGEGAAADDTTALVDSVSDVPSEIDTLRNALEVERKQHELDERALELVRSEIAAGSADRAALQEQLRFYRALMAPASVKQGVSIRPPQLVLNKASGNVAFSVIVQQKATKHQRVKGELTVQVKGMFAGQEVFYPVSELTDHLSEEEVELQFRYFQALEGELALPENFEPLGLKVTAQITKPKKVLLDETFPWKLQERFTHVGN